MPLPAHAMLLGGGASGPTFALPPAIMALSPVGYWKLNEPSGTTATDSSGNSRNGTYSGSGLTLNGATGGDGLLYADFGNGGNSSTVTIADNNAWSADTTTGLTFFMLIKPDSVAGTTQQHYLSKGGSPAFEWGFHINNGVGGRGQFWTLTAAGSAVQNGTMTGDPITTAWQAVVISLNAPSTNVAMTFYRNSNSDIYVRITAVASPYANGSGTLNIGWRADSPSGQYAAGGIAHVAIFGGFMSSGNVGSLMTAAHTDGWI